MVRRTFVVALLALGLMIGTAQAGPINSLNGITSWTALVNLGYGFGIGLTGTAVVIDRHTAWDQTGPGWISYAQTGPLGTILAPTYNTPIAAPEAADQRQAIVSFTRSFSGTSGSILNMRLWADDTAFMRVDGGAWAPATHVWGQSTCETNPVSCQQSKFYEANFVLGATSDNQHVFEVWAYQIGTGNTNASNPFGIQYDGSVPDGGATLMLLGGVLVGLGALRRRFRG